MKTVGLRRSPGEFPAKHRSEGGAQSLASTMHVSGPPQKAVKPTLTKCGMFWRP